MSSVDRICSHLNLITSVKTNNIRKKYPPFDRYISESVCALKESMTICKLSKL